VKLLTFLARRFAWTPHARTLDGASGVPEAPDATSAPPSGSVEDAVVVFVHAEARDEEPERRRSTLDHAKKHVEWLARKREMKRVVLHSFAHLGGASASSAFGESWMSELAARLEARGYTVARTPFGWTNAWELSVHGESIAKVWKDI
jgi:hypothetical protein